MQTDSCRLSHENYHIEYEYVKGTNSVLLELAFFFVSMLWDRRYARFLIISVRTYLFVYSINDIKNNCSFMCSSI